MGKMSLIIGPPLKACVLIALFLGTSLASASAIEARFMMETESLSGDTSIQNSIARFLSDDAKINQLRYPKSVQRFYHSKGYQPVWVVSETDPRNTWEALLMLDCVLQFGLSHADYHPEVLTFSSMHDIRDKNSRLTNDERIQFEVFLTDAILSFVNNLHFGKLNPTLTYVKIDSADVGEFSAVQILSNAIAQKDFLNTILHAAQPASKQYQLLQEYLITLKGDAEQDCFNAPIPLVRKIAINMERLRWNGNSEEPQILINIPSYELRMQTNGTTFRHKVIVGKPTSPTPELQSFITYFETAPSWNVPKSIFIKELLPKVLSNPAYLENNNLSIYDRSGKIVEGEELKLVKRNPAAYSMRQSPGCDNALGSIVFRFKNSFSIYLHDTPQKQFFDRGERALSHGCIRVQNAETLAARMLEQDGQPEKINAMQKAVKQYKRKIFRLRQPVSLRIIYLTCEIGDQGITHYKDVYGEDKSMEYALYGDVVKDNYLP